MFLVDLVSLLNHNKITCEACGQIFYRPKKYSKGGVCSTGCDIDYIIKKI